MHNKLVNIVKKVIKNSFNDIAFFDNGGLTYDRYIVVLNKDIYFLSNDFLASNGVKSWDTYSTSFFNKHKEIESSLEFKEVSIDHFDNEFIMSLFTLLKGKIEQTNNVFLDHLKNKDCPEDVKDSLGYFEDDIKLLSKIKNNIKIELFNFQLQKEAKNKIIQTFDHFSVFDDFFDPKRTEGLSLAIEYIDMHKSIKKEKTSSKHMKI